MTFEDQLVCVEFLLQVDSPGLAVDEMREDFRDLSSSLDHALRSVNRLEDRLQQIHQHCLLLVQAKTNSRVNLLTVISAIFLPLSLVAGIYGMNFKSMPELGWEPAYPLTLAAMALVASGMLLFFYRRGWFR